MEHINTNKGNLTSIKPKLPAERHFIANGLQIIDCFKWTNNNLDATVIVNLLKNK